jgi:TonB family protein
MATGSPGLGQDATSANLPENVEMSEAAPMPSAKKKKARAHRETAAETKRQEPVSPPEQMPSAEPARTAALVQKKPRIKKHRASVVQREPTNISTPTQLSLSAAQAMAVAAPLPEYPYQAKHANITGTGICVMTIDTASGNVISAMMAPSTGNAVLDKVTTETFRRWRFKPGTLSQARVPITYE